LNNLRRTLSSKLRQGIKAISIRAFRFAVCPLTHTSIVFQSGSFFEAELLAARVIGVAARLRRERLEQQAALQILL
jgi:hypothetical protein